MQTFGQTKQVLKVCIPCVEAQAIPGWESCRSTAGCPKTGIGDVRQLNTAKLNTAKEVMWLIVFYSLSLSLDVAVTCVRTMESLFEHDVCNKVAAVRTNKQLPQL